jgi:catechol 2,3-dioxygenase-like lactoylglutathione lyase family enzyme
MVPTLSGVHHVKFLVPDLEAAVSWYEAVLGVHDAVTIGAAVAP